MKLKEIDWSWGISSIFKSKPTQIQKCAKGYLNNFVIHFEIL